MSVSLQQGVDPERALAALTWASSVATEDPELFLRKPERPTPAELRAVTVADLRRHLDALLLGRHLDEGLEGLHEMGVLDVWLPEVAGMVGFGDGEWRHKDVWKHTKQVVWQSVPRLEVRWGALLHDIGKPKTRSISPNGEVHFHGHAELGASMFRKRIGPRLDLEGDLGKRIHFLILYHLRAGQYDGSWTDAAVRRFAKQMGPGLRDLLDLSRADITTKRPEKKKRGLTMISELGARIRELEKIDSRVAPLPKGLGALIAERFGVPPSKRLGEIRGELEALCEEGTIESGRDPDYYLDYI
ncbi:MAG: HDIG domain-containing protein, partial [Myxococcales bacterium]|nr:HDIG domain-containing protein [Myxococcales bacterium]